MSVKLKWSAEEDLILVQHVSAYLNSHAAMSSEVGVVIHHHFSARHHQQTASNYFGTPLRWRLQDIPPVVWREASEKLEVKRSVKQCRER